MSLIWYTSYDGANWNLMPSPSTYKITWEDLDNNSYRSVTTGNLIRDVIARRWSKIGLSWKVATENVVSNVCSSVNRGDVWFKVKSPAFGNGFISFKGYVSKMDVELLDGAIGYKMSFNIIQSDKAGWQGGE